MDKEIDFFWQRKKIIVIFKTKIDVQRCRHKFRILMKI